MSRSRRDESGQGRERTAEERERARLEREARRTGKRPPAAQSAPKTEHADPIQIRRQPRAPKPAPEPPRATIQRSRRTIPGGGAAGSRTPVRPNAPRLIQPQPPPPPAAPAGALDDETERPIGIRRARRAPRGPIVTPPGDTPPGPARRKRGSLRARLFVLLALVVLAVLLFGSYMLFQPFGHAEGDQVRVTIPAGASAREIGDQLAQAGVIDSGLLFSLRASLSGKRDELRSGTHLLRKDMTYGKAIAALSAREDITKPRTIDVTIPEGRSRHEIAAVAEKAGLRGDYLEASKRFKGKLNPYRYGAPRGTRSTEGFLFPATYELKPGAPARDLVERQFAAFKASFAKLDLARSKRKNLTGYDVLIIASMVEREAQLPKERPLIAAVIYNRLKDGIPLGIDATSRYALNKPSGALTRSELALDSPYNTRKRAGLPPTPIGNPGLASLRAAAAPARVGYRYFVVKPGTCGEHAFSDTIEQFERDSKRYNDAREQAGGKSPTTC